MNITPFDPLKTVLTGRNLIEASAGTGKTFAITRLYLRLIIERKLTVDQILVVTFTEAATNELKERIYETLLEAKQGLIQNETSDPSLTKYLNGRKNKGAAQQSLHAALQNFDEAAIFTIHRFCSRVLQQYTFESGGLFDARLIPEEKELLLETVQDFWRKQFYNASPTFLQYALKNANIDALVKLLANRTGRLQLHILPEMAEVDCAAAERAYEDAYYQAKHLWLSHRDEIVKMLFFEGLSGRQYRSEQVGKLLGDMDFYFSSKMLQSVAFAGLKKLTNAFLQANTKKNFIAPSHVFFDLCDDLFETHTLLDSLYNLRMLKIKETLFQYVKTELRQRKQKQNIYYFDDLLLNLYAALQRDNAGLAKGIRDKFPAALIDEFQDTDPVQYDIFNHTFTGSGSVLFLIGDPKQAIYSFRGADIFAYMQAKTQVAENKRFTLTTNYRSAGKLVSAVNKLFSAVENSFLYKAIPFYQTRSAVQANHAELMLSSLAEEPFQLWYWNPEEDKKAGRPVVAINKKIAAAVATEVARLLNLARVGKAQLGDRALQERDIAVLVRRNVEALEVQLALRRCGINSVLQSAASLFEADEVVEVEQILAAVIEPGRSGYLKAALATELLGVGAENLSEQDENEVLLEAWRLRFIDYQKLWRKFGFIRMFKELLSVEEVVPRLLAFADGERRVTNLLHLMEVLNEVSLKKRLGMRGLRKWLAGQRANIDRSLEEYQIRLESDEKAIHLITMHRSKGLEYPVVFCPFAWSASELSRNETVLEFHDVNQQNRLTIDLGSEQYEIHKRFAEKEKLAENLRLLYVSLTRAKQRCYLVWGPLEKSRTAALAYLLHKPETFDEDDPVQTLKSHLKELDANQFRQVALELASNSRGCIGFAEMPEAFGVTVSKGVDSQHDLSRRNFVGEIDMSTRISSFTGLTSAMPHTAESADHDNFLFAAPIIKFVERNFENFLTFPRGAVTGLFVHDLFENIDYANLKESRVRKLIEQKLSDYRLEEQWEKATFTMLQNVVNLRLTIAGDTFSLADISKEKRLNEMEFYFPLRKITPETLKGVFATSANMNIPEQFPHKVETLSFSPLKGFIKGFIDLVFEHNGKYYIVDWKSNYLGSTRAEYEFAALETAMSESYYILQYHLYVLAVHQYLKKRLRNYEYEKNFGGVIYLFVRGASSDVESKAGIYASKPPACLIEKLEKQLIDNSALL